MRILIVIAAFFAALASASATKYTPTTRPSPKSNEQLFADSLSVLSDVGSTIANKDKSSGLIVTEWEESESMGTEYRYRWRVQIGDGAVRVTSQCQYRMEKSPGLFGGQEAFKPCGGNEDIQPPERTTEAERLASSIAE